MTVLANRGGRVHGALSHAEITLWTKYIWYPLYKQFCVLLYCRF